MQSTSHIAAFLSMLKGFKVDLSFNMRETISEDNFIWKIGIQTGSAVKHLPR